MDSDLIQRLVQNLQTYLNCKQRADWLWEQIEMHLHTSYVAERLGDTDLVPKHLRAVAMLLLQAHQAQEVVDQHLHSSLQ